MPSDDEVLAALAVLIRKLNDEDVLNGYFIIGTEPIFMALGLSAMLCRDYLKKLGDERKKVPGE